ncbi:MAG: excinuclease ABC subunit A, partial [Prevotella sp.]|nr:excinuclease ABC subunit A [Prevotella sp.]
RFKQNILEVRYKDKNISDILDMTINPAIDFFESNAGKGQKGQLKLEQAIISRLRPLQDVGLGYIKLGQSSSTLSGGENQRVKLAYFIGQEKQEPTVFIFDEPTTGLHFHDIRRLLNSFDALILRGHTILIIEHNLDVIKCADHIIDIGPDGGHKGGDIVFAGTPEDIINHERSITGRFLRTKIVT